jgi:hypothetical protein
MENKGHHLGQLRDGTRGYDYRYKRNMASTTVSERKTKQFHGSMNIVRLSSLGLMSSKRTVVVKNTTMSVRKSAVTKYVGNKKYHMMCLTVTHVSFLHIKTQQVEYRRHLLPPFGGAVQCEVTNINNTIVV